MITKMLRPYQVQGVEKLIELTTKRNAAILADEPGLGKTIQVVEYINRTLPDEVLVVCPASLRINWCKELNAWLDIPEDFQDFSIAVASYESVVSFQEAYTTKHYSLVVFDEAHYLKNPAAKRTKACLAIPADTRLFLTGTPVVNRPMDLFPILQAIGLKYSKQEFGKRYCNGHLVQIRWKPRKFAWDFSGASRTEELNTNLRKHCMVRRTKAEVLTELPSKIRQVIELDIPHGESVALRDAVNRMFDGMKSAAENLSELKRIAFEELAAARLENAKHKLPYVLDYLRDLLEEESQVVVFAHHREIVAAIAEAIPGAVKLYGGMSDRQKDAAVSAFQSGKAPVFVGQIQAAGVGLTLTAARTVLFAELDWVPGNVIQAEDRCHRMGQTDTVRVIHLVAKDSVDARMVRALVDKQNIIERITK